jgi:DNA-binding HxlR family transcriptional regulator
MPEDHAPVEELVERVEPMLEPSREITQDLFELIGRQETDLHEEIDRTVETLQVFFNKWIVEIMYILRVRGVLRFNELKDSLGGISGRTLSTRLTDLEERGLVHRELYDEMPVRVEYSLTEKGHDVANLAMPLIVYLRADERAREAEEAGDDGE